ncbi:carboxymuconolactone decarboxylase family protein [Desulfobotulus sp.]|uniref:carboxymuconolactone decarboxylase family protein n=1 Tax=Desulfobotulus sp. TaxID=1940337 RepID=UPI002A36687B|nr:carboxymuconolactone decarboxylase family protein [Desulfobotulus sp.]MDY0164663.1 carboxymuconolactone decarboxylase family protein [Desulfobotulus sp.]
MDENIKILIGIGASVASNCQPCFVFHADQAEELGIDEAEVIEAIRIGSKIKQGGSMSMLEFISRSMGIELKDNTLHSNGCACS